MHKHVIVITCFVCLPLLANATETPALLGISLWTSFIRAAFFDHVNNTVVPNLYLPTAGYIGSMTALKNCTRTPNITQEPMIDYEDYCPNAVQVFSNTLATTLEASQQLTNMTLVIGALSVPSSFNESTKDVVLDALADVFWWYGQTVALEAEIEPWAAWTGVQELMVDRLFDEKMETGQVRIWSAIKGYGTNVMVTCETRRGRQRVSLAVGL